MTVELKAPKEMYRVVGVDTFDGTDWVWGDYANLEDAKAIVEYRAKKGGPMLKYYAYDEQGKLRAEAGTF